MPMCAAVAATPRATASRVARSTNGLRPSSPVLARGGQDRSAAPQFVTTTTQSAPNATGSAVAVNLFALTRLDIPPKGLPQLVPCSVARKKGEGVLDPLVVEVLNLSAVGEGRIYARWCLICHHRERGEGRLHSESRHLHREVGEREHRAGLLGPPHRWGRMEMARIVERVGGTVDERERREEREARVPTVEREGQYVQLSGGRN